MDKNLCYYICQMKCNSLHSQKQAHKCTKHHYCNYLCSICKQMSYLLAAYYICLSCSRAYCYLHFMEHLCALCCTTSISTSTKSPMYRHLSATSITVLPKNREYLQTAIMALANYGRVLHLRTLILAELSSLHIDDNCLLAIIPHISKMHLHSLSIGII